MVILSIHPGGHDTAVALFRDYDLVAAVQLERLTRRKGDGHATPHALIDHVLAIGGVTRAEVEGVVLSRCSYPSRFLVQPWSKALGDAVGRRLKGRDKVRDLCVHLRRLRQADAGAIFRRDRFLAEFGFGADVPLYFSNHHMAHALSAFFYTDWDDALLYTADGGGDNVHYSARFFRDGALTDVFGDDRWLLQPRRVESLGLAYGYMTQALGFRMNRHEGKLTGLAAFGEPTLLPALAEHFSVGPVGMISSDFPSDKAMAEEITRLAGTVSKEDAAASIQQLLENTILESVRSLLDVTEVRHLALAGGVFANVRLNRLLTERTGVTETFIFPGMGDEGLAVGGALEMLLHRDGLASWLRQRRRLETVYLGADHEADIDQELLATGAVRRLEGDPVALAADRLAAGEIVALYQGRMEFGPRALGARSILANPSDRHVNDTLNQRLNRTEFMPFAPAVLSERAAEVFHITDANRYACRFMTITCEVRADWRQRIPAVVHVDGTARPQIVHRTDNALYADLLAAFEARTGLPVLINTSFNAHEEPIINTPAECRQALVTDRVDYVVTRHGLYARV